MPIDSESKRRFVAGVLPKPDGTIDRGDRAHVAGIYRGLFEESTSSNIELVVNVELDTGTEMCAMYDIIGSTKYWPGRVVSFGDIQREISVTPGEFRVADVRVEFDDSANYWSNLRDTTPFKNRVLEIELLDFPGGESDLETVFKGKIQDWGSDGDVFWVVATDETLRRFDQPVAGVITKLLFPDLPDGTPLELMPVVIGTVSSAGRSNTGALPAYLIDPAISQSKYQYVCAQGTIKEVSNVYVYGVLVASSPLGYTVQQQTFGASTITTIEFDSDQRDVNRPDEIAVTWDGKGLTDDGTASGANITNPADIAKEFYLQNGFIAVDLDTPTFDAAALIFNIRNILGGLAVIDKAETLRTVSEKMAQSWNLTPFETPTGLIAVTVPEPAPEADVALVEIDESQIAQDSFATEGPDDLASDLEYTFARNWQSKEFDEDETFSDPKEQNNIGETIRKAVDLWYVRDTSSASAVINDKAFFMREARVTATFLGDPILLKTVRIGQDIRLTHFRGLGTAGFSEELFRVLGVSPAFDGLNILARIKVVDMREASFAFTKLFERFTDEDPVVWNDNQIPWSDTPGRHPNPEPPMLS